MGIESFATCSYGRKRHKGHSAQEVLRETNGEEAKIEVRKLPQIVQLRDDAEGRLCASEAEKTYTMDLAVQNECSRRCFQPKDFPKVITLRKRKCFLLSH